MKTSLVLPLVCLALACSEAASSAPAAVDPPLAEVPPKATATPPLILTDEPSEPAESEDEQAELAEGTDVAPPPKTAAPTQPPPKATTSKGSTSQTVATKPVPPEAKAPSAPPTKTPSAAPTKAPSDPPAASTTRIPNSKYVRVAVGAGLQKLLNDDSRMQAWVNKVMPVVERCYTQTRAKDASATGVIKVQITMHESARPSPDIKDLPPALSSVVACATGGLFQTRMPLFTGPEGERHSLSIHFTP